MPKESSKETAAMGGRIMALAKKGGPVMAYREEIVHAVRQPALNDDELIARVDAALRGFIDDAESLAASVVSQA